METELKMTLKEADRLAILKRVSSKNINLQQAALELKKSYRQTKRLWKRYREKGSVGVISLRRGKPSANQLPKELCEKVVSIIRKNYADYGPTLAMEKLNEKHKIVLAKETIRQLMIREGLWRARKRKEKKTHPRRTRRSKKGELVQIDGSYHLWFEDRGDKCCLIVFIDDATSTIMMRFYRTETTENYLHILKLYIGKYGRPLALYSDKHGIFRVNAKTGNEEGRWVTRFHEILKELDIELICAHSPQAKGRVERANGILQDRLIKEMRERGISTMEEGNQFLDEYAEIYNKKFGVAPAKAEKAYRKLLPSQKPDRIFMLKEERVLSKDLSFQYKKELYQIESKRVYALQGKKVLILELEGEIKLISYEGKELKFKKWKEKLAEPARIVDVKELEVLWPDKQITRPKRYHPWK
jgi:hypothetical protein